MGSWSDVWKAHAEDWVFGRLQPHQVPGHTDETDVLPDTAYLSIFLKSARILHARKGLKKFYGAVHSHMRVPHRSQQAAEFSVVTTPYALSDVDAGGIDRVIQLNQRLLGPVPYVGGDLEMQVGLFSIASSELAGPYLSLLETLSREAGVAFVGVALPFARPIAEGINLLADAGRNSMLEIGLSTTLSPPKQGYFVAVRAPKGALDLTALSVDPADYRLIDVHGRPFATYPYLVLELRADDERGDWFKIPDVAHAYASVQAEFRAGRERDTEEALTVFRRVVLTSNDLLPEDARRLTDKVRSLYDLRAERPLTRSVQMARGLPDLDMIDLYSD